MSLPAPIRLPAAATIFLLAVGLMLTTGGPSRAERAYSAKAAGSLCAEGIARQERELGIPRNLLAAISLAESGRWDESTREIVAWPWTVMAEGEGRYFARKAEAVAEVRALQRRGVTNIDVGCMQINLHQHPDAFAHLDEAFDPAANTAYAARFLVSLRGSAGSWLRAAAHYHSRTPDRAKAYSDKVRRLWAGLDGSEQKGGAKASQLAVAMPGDESVFDDIFLEPTAIPIVKPSAARTVTIPPIDHERTASFNGLLRVRRYGVPISGEAAAEPGLKAVAWQEANFRPGGGPIAGMNRTMLRTTPAADAARLPAQDAFAAKRQEQLARWRRDGRL